jgi:hypothetical protein
VLEGRKLFVELLLEMEHLFLRHLKFFSNRMFPLELLELVDDGMSYFQHSANLLVVLVDAYRKSALSDVSPL